MLRLVGDQVRDVDVQRGPLPLSALRRRRYNRAAGGHLLAAVARQS